MYRWPLPSTNLPFLSTVMWDGRETVAGLVDTCGPSDAGGRTPTTGHAQGAPPRRPLNSRQIVDFELSLFTAAAKNKPRGRQPDRTPGARRAGVSLTPAFLHRHQRSAQRSSRDARRVPAPVRRFESEQLFTPFADWLGDPSPGAAIDCARGYLRLRHVRDRQRRRAEWEPRRSGPRADPGGT